MQKKKTEKKRTGKTDETNLPVYCVCRSTDGERFMIACDRCEEWYHGDCISVTPKQAEQIKTFYCHQCRRKEPSLEIEYKSTRSQKSKVSHILNLSETDRSDEKHVKTKTPNHSISPSKHGIPERSVITPSTLDSAQLADFNGSPVGLLHGALNYNRPSPSFGHSKDSIPHEDDQISLPTIPRSSTRVKASSPRVRPCGTCSGCMRLEDCGKCDYCRDRRKFGGPNRIRQKCRLRQCVGSSHHKDPGLQTSGARRRKQPSLPNILGSSPLHTQYEDDDPFEIPMDFSPHPYSDQTSTIYSHHPVTSNAIVGSKMRRGDVRGTLVPHDLEAFPSYRRHPLDADAMEFLDEDSDEDLVLSGFPHCAGPACMSAPVAGGRYCSESCRMKHLNSRVGLRGTFPRTGPLPGEVLYPYNLPYPDHMYCRHHRVYNWHGNPSVTYRAVSQSYDQFDLDDTFHEARGRSTISYDSGQPLSISHRTQIHVPRLLNSNGRLNDLDNPDHSILCDTGDTAAFIDSVESAMMRGVVSLAGDLDLDPSAHPSVAVPHVSPTGNNYYPKMHSRPAVDLRHLEDSDDGLISELDADSIHDPSASNANSHYYYMLPYAELNRRNPGSLFTSPLNPGDRRMESSSIHLKGSTNHRLLSNNSDNSNGVGSSCSPVRTLGYSAGNGRHRPGPSNTSIPDNRVVPGVNDLSMVNLSSTSLGSLTSYIPGPDEFYTINYSEDIEINWPQESVSGVNT